MRTRNDILGALRERVLAGLHLGTLSPGDRLPSTRELAAALGVATRTVLAAYRALEAEGIVEMRPRSGIYVARGEPSVSAMLPQLAGWVVDVLVQSVARGIAPKEFPDRVRRCLETLRLRAACIECNADQMHSICTELHTDYGLESLPVDLDRLDADEPDAVAAVRTADLLVTTSAHAAEVQHYAETFHRPRVIISLRADLVQEMMRLLTDGPVYFVATDSRFVQALHDMLRPTGYLRHAHAVVLDRDDVDAIPEAPVYITSRARERLGDRRLPGRVIPTPRVFSLESARELLAFIVSANIAATRAVAS